MRDLVVTPASRFGDPSSLHLHPKLRNINPHNVTHALTSRNPRKRNFVVQISLLIVTCLSLISQN
jgi:hypothetical protein